MKLERRLDSDGVYVVGHPNGATYNGKWAVYEARCLCGFSWIEVAPVGMEPCICPKCGHYDIEVGPGMAKEIEANTWQ